MNINLQGCKNLCIDLTSNSKFHKSLSQTTQTNVVFIKRLTSVNIYVTLCVTEYRMERQWQPVKKNKN